MQTILSSTFPELFEVRESRSVDDGTSVISGALWSGGYLTVQIYWCKCCGKRFSEDLVNGEGGPKVALAIIAIDLHFKGVSLRNISDHLYQIHGVARPASTIQNWVAKLSKLIATAANNLDLPAGDSWLADEMFVKIRGAPKYLWNVMDFETRQLIVSLLMDGRGDKEALVTIKTAMERAGKQPKEILSDGLRSYVNALNSLRMDIQHIENVVHSQEG